MSYSGNVEPIVLDVDESRVRSGVQEANADIESYRKTGIRANQEIGNSAGETSKKLKVLSNDVSATDARLAAMASNQHSRFDKLIDDVERFGAGIERAGSGIERVFNGLRHAATGALEFAAAVVVGTKALAAQATASNIAEAALNRIRAGRIAYAGYVARAGGSAAVYDAALFTASEIAGIVAIEKTAVAAYDRAKEIERNAITSSRAGISYGDRETLNFITGRSGVSPDFFDNATKAAGGVDQLASKLSLLASERDPVERVRLTVAAFGSDADKILPFLGDRFGENAERVKSWGLQLSATERTDLDSFRRSIDSLKGTFTGFSDFFSAWGEQIAIRAQTAFAAIYRGLSELGHDLSAGDRGFFGIFGRFFGDLGSPQQIDVQGLLKNRSQYYSGLTADATRDILNTYGPRAQKIFAANRGDNEDQLKTSVAALAKQLFVQDVTSPSFGQLVPASQFPGGYGAQAAATQLYVSQQQRVDQIEKEKEAEKELEAARKGVAAIVRAEQLAELSGAERLIAQRDIALEQYGKTKALIEQIIDAYDRQAAAEQKTFFAQKETAYFTEQRRRAPEEITNPAFNTKQYVEATRLYEEGIDKRNKLDLEYAGISRDQQLRAIDKLDADTISKKVDLEDRKAAIEAEYLQRAEVLEAASIDRQYNAQLASLKILLDAKLIQQNAYDAQVQNLEQNRALDLTALNAKTNAAILDAREQAAQKAEQIVQQENQRVFDTFKHEAGGVFDALLTKSQNVFVAIGNAFKTAILTAVKDIVTSRIAASLTQLVTGSKVDLVTEAVGDTPIARFASRLGLGAKPHFAKLDQPNHLGDVVLSNGAVPVILMNSGAAATAGPSFSFGGTGLPAAAGVLAALGLALPAAAAVGAGASVPAGIVSSTINYGDGAIGTGPGAIFGAGSILGGPGGTSGFAGPVSLPGGASIGDIFGGPVSAASGSKGLGGLLSIFKGGGLSASTLGPLAILGSIGGLQTAFHLGQSNSVAGKVLAPALGAFSGLLGLGGLTALFPALAAAGPAGWIAAAGIGAFVGLSGLLFKSATQQAHDKIKSVYGVDISDNGILNQIVQMAKQGFGGNLDVAIRSEQVRQLIELYAMTTGQNSKGIVDHAVASTFANVNGQLTQQASYFNGSPVLPGDLNSRIGLPTLVNGNYVYSQSVTGANVVPQSISLQLDGDSSAAFLQGQTVAAIAGNPRAVSNANVQGQAQSAARRGAAAQVLAPNFLTA